MNAETNEMKLIMLAVSKECPTRIFRNNTGMAYQGKKKKNRDGSITLYDPRVVKFGLCEGSSDLIGATTITITQEMVGKKVAVFTALEVKTATGKASDDQDNFISFAKEFGGIGAVVKSGQEAVEIINSFQP